MTVVTVRIVDQQVNVQFLHVHWQTIVLHQRLEAV